MRTIVPAVTAVGLVMCGMLVSSCSEGPPELRIERNGPQHEPKIDPQLESIRMELEGKLLANNCSPNPSLYLECSNLAVACAVERPTSAADTANGVARRLTFWTSYIARGEEFYGMRADTTIWRDVHGYVSIQVNPDGTWQSSKFGTTTASNYNDRVADGFCRTRGLGERLVQF